MASKQTLNAIIQLYKKLGGNTSEVLGTKTNVNFLGKGKSPELMLDMDINPEALGVLPRSKAVEELTSSVGYAVSGKLNDIQANQLLKNMQTMDSVYFPPAAPANITDMVTGTKGLDKAGLESLRSMADDLPPPGSRGGADDISAPLMSDAEAPFTGAGLESIKNVKNNNLIVNDIVDKIYLNAGVSANAQPVARANAREFLNRIKDMEDPTNPGGPSLATIMEVDDFKFMTEGGGGGMGDPMLLVQKYFGPKVAASVAKLDNADDIQKFAENLVKVKDARGNTITSRYFDPESVDDFEFADGGKVPAADSQLVKESEGIMGYRGKEGIFPNFLKHGYFSEKRTPRTEKLDTIKEIFDEDTPNIQDQIDLSEGFTLSPITILRRILANMEIKKADGGRVPMFAGGAARMGYQALAKYGIKPKDISRLFASLGSDKTLVGKEKTEYFRMLHKVLRNPDDFPDEILDIQKQLGIDIPGLKGGGLAGILEV
jgi:hypothetical protein